MKKITNIFVLAALLAAAVFVGCAPVANGDGSGSSPSGTTTGGTVTTPQGSGVPGSSGSGTTPAFSKDTAVGAISGTWTVGSGYSNYLITFYPDKTGTLSVPVAPLPSVRAGEVFEPVKLASLPLDADYDFTWDMRSSNALQIFIASADGTILYIDFVYKEASAKDPIPTLAVQNEPQFTFKQDLSMDPAMEVFVDSGTPQTMTTLLTFEAVSGSPALPGVTIDPTDPENAKALTDAIKAYGLASDNKLTKKRFPVMWSATSDTVKTANVWILDVDTTQVKKYENVTYAANYVDDDDDPDTDPVADSIILYVPTGSGTEEHVLVYAKDDASTADDDESANNGFSDVLVNYAGTVLAVLDSSDDFNAQVIEDTLDVDPESEVAALLGETIAAETFAYWKVIEEGEGPYTYEKEIHDGGEDNEPLATSVEEIIDLITNAKNKGGTAVIIANDPGASVMTSAKFYFASNKFKVAVKVLKGAKDSAKAAENAYVGTYAFGSDKYSITYDGEAAAAFDITLTVVGETTNIAVANNALPKSAAPAEPIVVADVGKYEVTKVTYGM